MAVVALVELLAAVSLLVVVAVPPAVAVLLRSLEYASVLHCVSLPPASLHFRLSSL